MFFVVIPHIYVVAAVVIASLFPLTYRSWHSELHHLMQKLADEGHESPRDEDDDCITLTALKQRIGELPTVVKQWLECALSLSSKSGDNDRTMIPFVRTLRIEQEGKFFLNERWVPFTATQEFSARQTHPGFVWDAKIGSFGGCNLGVPILVLDAYIHGIGGIMKARLPLGIPTVNMKDTDDLNLGEIMRWLAEATLFPMALIPQEHGNNEGTALKWSPGSYPDSAILEFTHNNQTAKMNFYFDPDTHLVTAIKAKRPKIMRGKTEMCDWEVHFLEYKVYGGLLVPTEMEVGWKLSEESALELYFKGKNTKFIYLTNAHTRHESADEKDHIHKD